jgi:site-specific recombinase XerD
VVTLRDAETGKRRNYHLGRYDSPESWERYHDLLARWQRAGRRLPDEPPAASIERVQGPTVNRLIAEYWDKHAARYYVKLDGSATSTLENIRAALRPLRALYGRVPADSFNTLKLLELRESMVQRGWVRATVNMRVKMIVELFRWGVERRLVAEATWRALRAVRGLRRGEAGVREGSDVEPVPQELIDAVRPFVSPQVWSLIQLQLYTAARPGELVIMRPLDLDTTRQPWFYYPVDHKNAHRGKHRTIYLGPQAQAIVKCYIETRTATDAYLFDPREAHSQAARTARQVRYTENAYRRTIQRACDQAYPPPGALARQPVPAAGRKEWRRETDQEWTARLTEEQLAELKEWRQAYRWHPHQLRHNAGTYLRKEFGIETARLRDANTNIRSKPDVVRRNQGACARSPDHRARSTRT